MRDRQVLHHTISETSGRDTDHRPRLMITETDKVSAALDAAAERRPQVWSHRQLLLKLVEQGGARRFGRAAVR
jgi:hypothetical protein